ncbi:hypothetical protein Thiofri_02967 [Thiorhodovibrio frisius]|nr:hypothetical protein Thiofri_02967 [Thiorhodovibrio frisius]
MSADTKEAACFWLFGSHAPAWEQVTTLQRLVGDGYV